MQITLMTAASKEGNIRTQIDVLLAVPDSVVLAALRGREGYEIFAKELIPALKESRDAASRERKRLEGAIAKLSAVNELDRADGRPLLTEGVPRLHLGAGAGAVRPAERGDEGAIRPGARADREAQEAQIARRVVEVTDAISDKLRDAGNNIWNKEIIATLSINDVFRGRRQPEATEHEEAAKALASSILEFWSRNKKVWLFDKFQSAEFAAVWYDLRFKDVPGAKPKEAVIGEAVEELGRILTEQAVEELDRTGSFSIPCPSFTRFLIRSAA